MKNLFRKKTGQASNAVTVVNDQIALKTSYVKTAPSNQNAVDIFNGAWISAFPPEYDVQAGHMHHFDPKVETRVDWGAGSFAGGIQGKSILELGPFEAYQTYLFEKRGAGDVLAIEACNISYLKCLIVKEITGIKSRFLYGDFIPFLEATDRLFDIVWASGVLYHQSEPLKLLGLMAKTTDRIFIHTHYYEPAIIEKNPNMAQVFSSNQNVLREYQGYQARLHYRSYRRENQGIVFAGGAENYSFWMEKEDIFGALRHFGFSRFDIGVDDPQNPSGPAMFFTAQR